MIVTNEDAIAQDYSIFLKEKDLPPAVVKIDIDSLPIRAFITWRVITSNSYIVQCVSDPPNLESIITYYDMYEIPTCYRQIRLSWTDDIPKMIRSARPDKRFFTTGTAEFKDYIREVAEYYLLSIGFLTHKKPPSAWSRIKRWFTSKNSD